MGAKHVIQDLTSQMGIGINGNRPWDVRVHNDEFYDRVLKGGTLALGETYMEGWWDTDNLHEMLYRAIRWEQETGQKNPVYRSRLWERMLRAAFNLQTKSRAPAVAEAHYNLSPQLYEYMLGPTMAYSCGYWAKADNLDDAQIAKLDLICRKLQLKPGERLLDVGCGWGTLARYAAEHYGVDVTAITIASEQAEYARRFCHGLPVDIQLLDYRDLDPGKLGQFDKVVSLAMFEAVGRKNYRVFMKAMHRMLKNHSIWLLHTIGTERDGFDPWSDKYIFPNGEIPTKQRMVNAVNGLFHLEDWHNFGVDYSRTLLAWYDNFVRHWPEIQQLDSRFDQRFYRMWTFYLQSFASVFRSRNLNLWQLVLSKGCLEGGYVSCR